MPVDLNKLFARIQAMEYYEVDVEFDEPFRFNGRLPFDVRVVGSSATFTVLAESYESAERKVFDYLDDMEED